MGVPGEDRDEAEKEAAAPTDRRPGNEARDPGRKGEEADAEEKERAGFTA